METTIELRHPAEEFVGRGEVKNFQFRMLEKTDHGYLYSATSPEGSVGYEVFRKMPNPRFGIYSYPGSNSFGIWAWMYRDLEKAKSKLESLHKPQENEQADNF